MLLFSSLQSGSIPIGERFLLVSFDVLSLQTSPQLSFATATFSDSSGDSVANLENQGFLMPSDDCPIFLDVSKADETGFEEREREGERGILLPCLLVCLFGRLFGGMMN